MGDCYSKKSTEKENNIQLPQSVPFLYKQPYFQVFSIAVLPHKIPILWGKKSMIIRFLLYA